MWNFIQFQLKYIRDRQIGREAQNKLATTGIDSSEEVDTQPNTAENTPKKQAKSTAPLLLYCNISFSFLKYRRD